MGWPDHVNGAPLTAEMVLAAHNYDPKDAAAGPWPDRDPIPIPTNCYVLDVEMGPIVKYKVHAHIAGTRVPTKNYASGIYVQFPGSDGVSLHLEVVTDESVRG